MNLLEVDSLAVNTMNSTVEAYLKRDDRAFNKSSGLFYLRHQKYPKIGKLEFVKRLRSVLDVEWTKVDDGTYINPDNSGDILITRYARYFTEFCEVYLHCGDIQMEYVSVLKEKDNVDQTTIKLPNFSYFCGETIDEVHGSFSCPRKTLEAIIKIVDVFSHDRKVSPLNRALSYGNMEAAEWLLKHGEAQEDKFTSLIEKSVEMGALEHVKLLLRYNPKVERVLSALMEAEDKDEDKIRDEITEWLRGEIIPLDIHISSLRKSMMGSRNHTFKFLTSPEMKGLLTKESLDSITFNCCYKWERDSFERKLEDAKQRLGFC